jgi:hypothetical protein
MPHKKFEIELTPEEALYLLQFSMLSAKNLIKWSEEVNGVLDAQTRKRINLAKKLYVTLTNLYPTLTKLVEPDWNKIKDIET